MCELTSKTRFHPNTAHVQVRTWHIWQAENLLAPADAAEEALEAAALAAEAAAVAPATDAAADTDAVAVATAVAVAAAEAAAAPPAVQHRRRSVVEVTIDEWTSWHTRAQLIAHNSAQSSMQATHSLEAAEAAAAEAPAEDAAAADAAAAAAAVLLAPDELAAAEAVAAALL